ncbi:MAG: hypothetical protein WCX22_00470 [Methanoregula sp.]
MKRYHFGLIALLLLAALAILPVAGGSNDTWDQSYYLTHKETLAGQKDMSRYNPPVMPVPIQTMNATIARLYPNMTACGKDGCLKPATCPFSFLRCGRSLTVMVIYNMNGTRPGEHGPVVSAGISGEIFPEPVNLYRVGIPDFFLQFSSLSGWPHEFTGSVTVHE